MRVFAIAAALAVLLSSVAAAEGATPLPFQVVQVQGGLDFPVSFAFGADGEIYVTEKEGVILEVRSGAAFEIVRLPVESAGEQGLLGLALEPGFGIPQRMHLYVFHTFVNAAQERMNRVVRFWLGATPGPMPVNETMEVVFCCAQAGTIHNGGILAFGGDGTLFISTGDAGTAPWAQDPGRPEGKILRIEANGSVPASNPFPGNPVYSYGHRNVFGLAEDPETQFLWETENGPSQDDEVNRIVAGGNYGWPNVTGVAGRPEFRDPEFVFPGPLPALTQATFLDGFLYFGGWNSGTVYRATLSGDRRSIDRVDAIHRFPGGVTDIEAGPDGRLYVSVVNSATGDGIYALTGETAPGDHWLVYGIGIAAIAVLVLVYLWRRRRLRRERS